MNYLSNERRSEIKGYALVSKEQLLDEDEARANAEFYNSLDNEEKIVWRELQVAELNRIGEVIREMKEYERREAQDENWCPCCGQDIAFKHSKI